METYMDDAAWEVEQFLLREKIDQNLLSQDVLNDMAYQYYKNYYSYDMDNEFALRAAVSEVLRKNNIVVDGFEEWIP